MGKYFKFIGWIAMLGFIVGAVWLLILVFGLIGQPGFWLMFLYFALTIVFGPAVGLLFLSYGALVEEEEEKEAKKKEAEQKETRFIDTKPKSSSVETEEEWEEDNNDLIIAQLIISDKFGEESIERLRTLSKEELLVLLDEAYPNKDDAPKPLKLDEVTIKGEMIGIKSSSYNMKTARLRDIEMTSKTLVFTLFSTKYVIMFNNFAGANLLYKALREALQQE